MEINEKVELNKKIKSYDGTNSFLLSLQKQLKTNTKLNKEDFKGRQVKVLSDKLSFTTINRLMLFKF
jgi:hypothetical protein